MDIIKLIPTRDELEWAQAQMQGKTLQEQMQHVALLWSDLEGYPEEQETLIEACAFWSIGLFAFEYFPEYISTTFGKHHEQIFECIPRGARGQHVNILAPRGAGKSVCMSVIYPLHCIYYKYAYEALEMPPYHYIVILSKSQPMAISRIYDIQRKIYTDDRFAHLASRQRTGVKYYLCHNDEMLLVPQGRGGQIRGSLFRNYRPDLIISDDLDDPETVRNPDVREKDQLWFDSDLMRAGSIDGQTNFINIDTLKHAESTASLLRDRADWKTLLFRAIEDPADLWHPTHEEHWKQWEKIYTDLTFEDVERKKRATAFYWEHLHETAIEPHVQHLWSETITYLQVRQEICNVGYYPVLRELQNSTHDPSQALFDIDSAVKFDIVAEGFLRTDKRIVKWQEMAGATVFLDWAGGKDIAENAYAAVVAVVWCPLPGSRQEDTNSIMDGVHGYVLGADVRRIGATQQIMACFDMHDVVKSVVKSRNFRIRLGIEGFVQDTWDAQRQVIERDFISQRERRGLEGLFIEWLPRLRNKFDRIDALQPLISNGWLAFNKGLPNEFVKQMSLYPTGDFLDAPDALEGACQLRVSTFESERKERKEQARKRNREFRVKL